MATLATEQLNKERTVFAMHFSSENERRTSTFIRNVIHTVRIRYFMEVQVKARKIFQLVNPSEWQLEFGLSLVGKTKVDKKRIFCLCNRSYNFCRPKCRHFSFNEILLFLLWKLEKVGKKKKTAIFQLPKKRKRSLTFGRRPAQVCQARMAGPLLEGVVKGKQFLLEKYLVTLFKSCLSLRQLLNISVKSAGRPRPAASAASTAKENFFDNGPSGLEACGNPLVQKCFHFSTKWNCHFSNVLH